jgi:ribosomal protein L34E
VTPDIARTLAMGYAAELRAAPEADRAAVCEAFRRRLRDSLIQVRDTEFQNIRTNHKRIEREFGARLAEIVNYLSDAA